MKFQILLNDIIYIDKNYSVWGNLRILIDGNGKIVWHHKGYIDGDEEELYEQIESLVSK